MNELTRLLDETLEYKMTGFHTAFPGVVEKYDAATRRADIQPSIKRKMPDGEYASLPIIPDVPVRYCGNKQFTIHFPLEKGDEVLLIVTERATDTWKAEGGQGIEEKDLRRFDIQDCIAITGNAPKDFIPVKEDGLNIVHKTAPDGEFISRITMDDNRIEIKYREKADVVIEDDKIRAQTEKCTFEMFGEKVNLTNGKDEIIADSGNVEVSALTKAVIKAAQVEITGGILKVDGMAAPTGSGPFCGIPACLFTGAPHTGDTVAGT